MRVTQVIGVNCNSRIFSSRYLDSVLDDGKPEQFTPDFGSTIKSTRCPGKQEPIPE